MVKSYTLGKTERLKSRKRLEALFKEGHSFAHFPFRVYYKVSQIPATKVDSTLLVFGVGVGTKKFKKAVERNRIKRLIRETYRLQKQSLVQNLNVLGKHMDFFIIYTGKELPDYASLLLQMKAVLQKLEQVSGQSNE